MLLPSALSCDSRRPSRFTPMRLFSTPPPSDDDSGLPGNGLLGTCRALQSLLNVSPAPSSRRAKPARLQSPLHIVPTPPSPASSRKHKRSLTPRKSPTPKPSRGVNKRRRNTFEEDTHTPIDLGDNTTLDADANPSTPKRRRHLPYDLPLGLSQTDFYSLYSPPVTQSPPSPAQRRQQECHTPPPFNPDAALPSIEEPTSPASNQDQDQGWTSDDDQRLVELVLEKFRLSKQDWDDCARRMGKDHASVGQRWQALVGEGNVGLRRGRRRVRSRIHKDWM
ncbi:hypothetical protein BJX61DRAFT_506973 [Aspergillus egyptiacus]|nr:hypothetical protein BJX61DRAFT_506973 [Aspergillus egyptiacus]